jgi:hypothetical protein
LVALGFCAWAFLELVFGVLPTWLYVAGNYGGAGTLAGLGLSVPIVRALPLVRTYAPLTRGHALFLDDKVDESIAFYERAVTTKKPAIAYLAKVSLAGALHHLGREPERALGILEDALASSPKRVHSEDALHAHLLLTAGRRNDAEAAFERFRAAKSRRVQVRDGQLIVVKGDLEPALRHLLEGWYHLRVGRFDEAIPLLESVVRLDAAPVATNRARRLLESQSHAGDDGFVAGDA